MGRPPLQNKQRQIAVALPPDLRERLEKAASASQHSIAMEIRQRLEQTFSAESVDKATRELVFTIEDIAELVRTQTGRGWHGHHHAWWIFWHAINALLRRAEPLATGGLDRTKPSGPSPRPFHLTTRKS